MNFNRKPAPAPERGRAGSVDELPGGYVRVRRDLDSGEFLALCARSGRGEVRLESFGTGSSNGRWLATWVEKTTRKDTLV